MLTKAFDKKNFSFPEEKKESENMKLAITWKQQYYSNGLGCAYTQIHIIIQDSGAGTQCCK